MGYTHSACIPSLPFITFITAGLIHLDSTKWSNLLNSGSQCRSAREKVLWFKKGATPQPLRYGAPGMFRWWSLVVAGGRWSWAREIRRFGECLRYHVKATSSDVLQGFLQARKLWETAKTLRIESKSTVFCIGWDFPERNGTYGTMLQASLLREMLQLQLPDDGDRLRMQTCLSIHRTHGDLN